MAGREITIEHLPNEILEIIFAHLSIVDHVKLERVNHRWRHLCRHSWRNSGNSLSLDHHTWGFRNPNNVVVEPISVQRILERCGRYIHKVKFSKETEGLLQPNILNHVARLCPNLTELDTGHLISVTSDLEVVGKYCKNLEILTVGPVISGGMDGDIVFSALFSNNPRLRCVFFNENQAITGTCLYSLNPEIVEQLALIHCPNFNTITLRAAMKFTNALRIVIEPFNMRHTIFISMNSLHKLCEFNVSKLIAEDFKLVCVKNGVDRLHIPDRMAMFLNEYTDQPLPTSAHGAVIINKI